MEEFFEEKRADSYDGCAAVGSAGMNMIPSIIVRDSLFGRNKTTQRFCHVQSVANICYTIKKGKYKLLFLLFSEGYLFSLQIDTWHHYAPFQFCKYVPMHMCHLGKDLFP